MAESREKSAERFDKFWTSLPPEERLQYDVSLELWEAGRRDALEEAAKIAEAEGATPRDEGGNVSRWDACDNVAAAIRALET